MFVNFTQRNAIVYGGERNTRPVTAFEKRENAWKADHSRFFPLRPKTPLYVKPKTPPMMVCNKYARTRELNFHCGYEDKLKHDTVKVFRESERTDENRLYSSYGTRPYYQEGYNDIKNEVTTSKRKKVRSKIIPEESYVVRKPKVKRNFRIKNLKEIKRLKGIKERRIEYY